VLEASGDREGVGYVWIGFDSADVVIGTSSSGESSLRSINGLPWKKVYRYGVIVQSKSGFEDDGKVGK
jgi:hypothetical protein